MLGIARTRELRAAMHTFVLILHRQFECGDRFRWCVLSVLGVGLTRSWLENVAHFELVAITAVVFGVQHLLEEQAHLFANQRRAVPFDAVLALYLLRLRLLDLGDPHQRRYQPHSERLLTVLAEEVNA